MTTLVTENTEFPFAPSEPSTLYLAILERGPSGWAAYVPDLPGVVAAAETEAETRALIDEAMRLHVDELRDGGDPVPEPVHSPHWVSL